MAKRRGGGFFTSSVTDAASGAVSTVTNWKNIVALIVGIVIVGVIIGVSVYFGLRPRDSPETPKSGGAVAPPFSGRPGRINIAEVAQAPSAGQGIIYFSQAEERGTLCDTCTAEFDIDITYTGGNPQPPPAHKIVTAPSTSGVVRFDYSVFTPDQPTPGQNVRANTTPPTSMQIVVNARSMIPGTRTAGGTTTFSKTLPYVA